MLAPDLPAQHGIAWVKEEWPSAVVEQELPRDAWLPAREVTLMTLAAFALIALFQLSQ